MGPNTQLQLLLNEHRRRLLVYLLDGNPEDRHDIPADIDVPDDEQDAIEVEMFHKHLPMLDDANVIDWDREIDVVTRGKNFDELRPLLELIANHHDELPEEWL